MTLTLEIISTTTGMPSHRQRSFREDGGRIGRDKSSDWVLPHNKVSSRHAVITYRNGIFYIEDRSRNGVFLNSTTNRLTPGRPQALQSGDVLFIEPYEIQVSVAEEVSDSALQFDRGEDPFAPPAGRDPYPPLVSRPEQVPSSDEFGDEVDPLKLLGGSHGAAVDSRPSPPRDVVSIEELERRPLAGHYQPPAVVTPPPAPHVEMPAEPEPVLIPEDYDPLADAIVSDPLTEPPPVAAAPVREPEPPAPPPPPPSAAPLPSPFDEDPFAAPGLPAEFVEPRPTLTPPPVPAVAPVPPTPRPKPKDVSEPAPVVRPREERPEPQPARVTPPPQPGAAAADLAAVLAGAGLPNVPVTPELAESFGRILNVVVAGVMDLLRARQHVKDELRMRQTQFRPADNNPLKFSANVEDALHNLLLKRNPAYLKPVDAFADAFDDLRDHQLAMLAGLRVAFEAMLAEFDPARLEEQVDRQGKKGALLSVPAKLRYWDAYRDRSRQLMQDMDATFRKWFGEEFVKAYEEQLEKLESERGERKP